MLSFSRNVINKRAFYVNGLHLHSYSVLFQEGLAAQNNHSRCFSPAPDGGGWRRDQKKTDQSDRSRPIHIFSMQN